MRAERISASLRTALSAAAGYFALVFAAGFVLGTGRVLVLEPALGAVRAVLIETPVILAVSWITSGALVRRLAVPARVGPRLIMGVGAFGLLLLAELALSVWAFGRTPGAFLAGLAEPAGLIGLAGQTLFAAFPAVRLIGGGEPVISTPQDDA